MAKTVIIIAVSIVAVVALNVYSFGYAAVTGGTAAPKAQVCFAKSKWAPAPDKLRPCVQVTRLYEDGSFTYRVSDASGKLRFAGSVGAQDR